MAIDVFLPTVVRQAISIDKSGSNVSGTLIPQKDPSGEENRGVKGQPSPTELFGELFGASSGAQNTEVQAPSASQPTPPKLATPPFADYLAQEQKQKNQAGNQQTYQPLSPLTMQEMPPVISEFLNDIAKQHGVEAPSQQQLQSALKMTSDYRPPNPVIIDTKPVSKPVPKAIDQKAINTPEISITLAPIATPPPVVKPAEPQQRTSEPDSKTSSQISSQMSSQISGAYSARFDALSEDIQKSALDYGRMLEALNRYSVTIQDNN